MIAARPATMTSAISTQVVAGTPSGGRRRLEQRMKQAELRDESDSGGMP